MPKIKTEHKLKITLTDEAFQDITGENDAVQAFFARILLEAIAKELAEIIITREEIFIVKRSAGLTEITRVKPA